jgi:hypothetical protein
MAEILILPIVAAAGVAYNIHENNKEKHKKKCSHPPSKIETFKPNNEKKINYETTNSKYYNDSNESLPGKFTSISGDMVDMNTLKHNNMKPFFGSKVKQRGVSDTNYILDNMQGSGSEHFRKKEQETLFKPTKDLGWNHGTPSSSDFIQSRMNQSMMRNNDKPWEEVRVAPGLNQGFGDKGSGGFNSSLESRGQWIDKTVDELRTVNNPKVSYDGVTLGGKNISTNRGIEGKVEKYKPDTYYNNTPDRYLTTTGAHMAHTAHSEQVMGNPNRTETSIEYYGNKANSNNASYVKKNFQPTKRMQLKTEQLGGVHTGTSSLKKDKKKSYRILPNARSTTEENTFFGGLMGIAKEVIMPLSETLRPSKKENVIGNLHSVGNVGVRVSNYVSNKQPARRTTKETTATTERLANVGNGGISGNGYLTNAQTPVNTQRTTTTRDYFGPSGNTQRSTNNAAYGAFYNAHTNTSKEEVSKSRANVGNMKMFNNTCNTQTIRTEEVNDYIPSAHGSSITPGMETHGSLSSREPVKQDDRLGGYLVDSLSTNPYNRSVAN